MLSTIARLVKSSKRLQAAPADRPSALPEEVGALAVVLREEFDTPFRFYEAATGVRVAIPGAEDPSASTAPREADVARELATAERPIVRALPGARYLIGFPMAGLGSAGLVGIGMINGLARAPAEVARERERLEKWGQSVHGRLVAERGMHDSRRSQAEQGRQSLIAWEAIMALERLHRGASIHKDPARERRRILRAAAELIGAQAMIWIPAERDDPVVTEGEHLLSPWDCGQLADALNDQAAREETGYVLINEPRATSWGARFPKVLNLLAIPVADRRLNGWMLALNKRRVPARGGAGREARPHRDRPGADQDSGPSPIRSFRRTDAALLLPFASLIGLLVRGTRRYRQLKDLLVGLTRSLTAAIDAKDAYTYGHSERVARVAVELGRALGLQEDELSDIYLAGLLHDIGKIGIRDDVLTKRGPLTDEEYRHIQQHVVIGHRILADLRAIEHLLPGVLYHHERYDGKGYPEGIVGDAIPLLARILAVADSFDAMSTSRPYRTAMSPDRVHEILRQGAGTQWDPLIIDAYLQCHDRIAQVRDRGIGESLRHALDGALRHGHRGHDLASIEMSIG